MKFTARVKPDPKYTDSEEWIDMPIRVILLDKDGRPECVVGASGLQYDEFELEVGDKVVTAKKCNNCKYFKEHVYKSPGYYDGHCEYHSCDNIFCFEYHIVYADSTCDKWERRIRE